MATVTDAEEVIEYEEFIDQQIATTSFHVKTVDLLSGVLLLFAAVLGLLFAIVLVDHWIIGLTVSARVASLVTLILSTVGLFIWKVLPPLFRSVNPDYSAQAVERSFPILKNGLISFLFFRDRPEQIKQSVFEGMKAQAATDLAEIPIDSAVDRTPIIRLGYALVTVSALWVGYLLLSPKSPVQTLQRIAAPWSDIQRPSKVDIAEVTPGHADVFQGRTIDVKAKIAGLKDDQLPAIEFSTLDGQLLNQRLPLHQDGASDYFAGTLTMGEHGIEQDLEYRIVAGDATSHSFQIRAVESPHIVVDHIEFDYPSYTGQPDEVVQGDGNIRAIEGTRVTIHGKANQPMRRGHIELLPVVDPTTPPSDRPASKQASLSVGGDDRELGEVRLTLRLDEKQKPRKPLYRGYQLHFTNDNDLASVDAIEHSLEVVPDLRPIVQILTPERRTIELPENGWHKIEVRALDPDFQLTQVQLAARANRENILRKNLFLAETATSGHTGQFVATYRFIPREHGLRAGDVVEYLALAKDNRHSAVQNKLAPNLTITAKQYIRIVEADPLADQPPQTEDDQVNAPDQPQPEPTEPEQQNPDLRDQGEQRNPDGENEKHSDQQAPGEESNPNPGNSENQNAEQQPGQQQQQPGEEQGREANEQQQGDQSQQGQNQQSSEQDNQQGREDADSGTLERNSDESGDSEQRDVNSGTPGESQGDSGEQQQPGQNGGDRQANGQQEDSGQNSGQQNQGQNRSGGNERQRDGSNGNRATPDDEPLPSTGERDGEVVERIRRHMEEKGELDNQDGQPNQGDTPPENSGAGAEQSDGSEANPDSSTSPNQQDQTAQSNESSDANTGDAKSDGSQSSQNRQGNQPNDGQQSEHGQENQQAPDSKTQPSGQSNERQEQSDEHQHGGEPCPTCNGTDPNCKDCHGSGRSSGQKPGGQKSGNEASGKESGNSDGSKPGKDTAGQDGSKEGTSRDASGQQGSSTNDGDVPQPNDNQESSRDTEGSPSNDSGKESTPPSQTGDNKPSNQNQAEGPDAGQGNNRPPGSNSQSTDGNSDNKSNSSKNKPSQPGGTAHGQGQGTNHGDGHLEGGQQADDANLEYAREATDLVLEYLRDQKNKPDRELLDKLGWNQEDVQKFVRRWDEMKRKAGPETGPPSDGQRELDDVLRGMGLQAPSEQLRKAGQRNDAQRDNRNTGRRTKVPAKWLDPFRAFQRALQGE